jgi:hypothetical protein
MPFFKTLNDLLTFYGVLLYRVTVISDSIYDYNEMKKLTLLDDTTNVVSYINIARNDDGYYFLVKR